MTALLLQVVNGISFGMLLFLVAAGFTIVFGFMNFLNLAHGSLFMLGAYLGLSAYRVTGSFWLSLAAGTLTTAIAGLVLERLLLHRFYSRGHAAQTVLTFGVVFIIGDATRWIWGAYPLSMPPPSLLEGSISIAGQFFPTYRLFLLACGVVMAVALRFFLERTSIGAIVRAGVEDAQMVRALGVRLPLVFLCVFVGASGLAGFAGVLGAPFLGLQVGMDLDILLLSLAIVVVGGLGSIKGAFIGSLIIGVLDRLMTYLVPELAQVTLMVLIILFLAIRPAGLFGSAVPRHSTQNEFDLPRVWRRPAPAFGALALVTLVTLPFVSSTYLTITFTEILILGIAVVGTDLVIGYGGLVTLGSAGFIGIGAYSAGLVAIHATNDIVIAVLIAVAMTMFIAGVTGFVALRASGVHFIMLTLAFSQILFATAQQWASVTGGDDGLVGIPVGTLLTVDIFDTTEFYFLTLSSFIATVLITTWLLRTKLGSELVGARDDRMRIESLGSNARRTQLMVYCIAASFAGFAGVLLAFFNGIVAPTTMGVLLSATLVLAIFLGGQGTIVGPVVGLAIIQLATNYLSSATARWELVLGAIFVLVVMFVPGGVIRPERPQWISRSLLQLRGEGGFLDRSA